MVSSLWVINYNVLVGDAEFERSFLNKSKLRLQIDLKQVQSLPSHALSILIYAYRKVKDQCMHF